MNAPNYVIRKLSSNWKNRSIDYNECEYLPDKKSPIVIKTCFCEGKLMKQFGNPPLSKSTPPPFSEQFFSWPPSLSKFQKQPCPAPALLILGWRKLWIHTSEEAKASF